MQPLHALGSPTPSAGKKSELAASPLPSPGAKNGRSCYATPAFLGVPNAKCGEKIRIGCVTPAFSGALMWAELLRNPCIIGGPQHQARGLSQNGLPHPCLLRPSKPGGIAMQSLHAMVSPTPSAGTKSELDASPLPSLGPKSGRICYATLAFSVIPTAKRKDKIRIGCLSSAFSGAQKWAELLRNPCILGGPEK